ncbi:alpha/beta hydrolase [Sphingomonas deserti]|uniref:Alpha/beta hydrolase n=2 Tax=Allosphingosinicella deserti TaxID=2116704 RepID=A0A2P7QWH5_9SPHN|nr:alpha/beta hydrolase [Sphingomonas deserti]
MLALACAAAVPIHAQPRSAPDLTVADAVVEESPPHPIAFSNGATALPGLVYARRPGFRPLTLDLYRPPAQTTPPAGGFPLIVYVHGGAWLGGSPRLAGAIADFPATLAGLAARGYVVASISYRLSAEAKFPAQIDDLRTALRWLRAGASRYRMHPARAAIWGASAGGHLAALAAAGCENGAFDPPQPGAAPERPDKAASACVDTAVIWYGVFDLAAIAAQAGRPMAHRAPDAPEWRLLGCVYPTCLREAVTLASPISHVDAKDPPMLLIAGDSDKIVPSEQSRQMAAALDRAGVRNRLILIPGADHSFIGPTSAQTRKATVSAVEATFAWFDTMLKGKDKARR